ncbi:MAG: hypothetical protein MJ067_04985 [Oscillospiraceae bacterium]|nr:hypothetical protein [Oscillospiraceae bacterium]
MKEEIRGIYTSKLIKKEEVMSYVKDNDRIVCHGGATSFLGLLDENIEKLHGIELFTMFLLADYYSFLKDEYKGNINHHAAFVSSAIRKALGEGQRTEINLVHFGETDSYVRNYCRPTLLAVQCSPPDEDGYLYMGYNSMGHIPAIEMADRIIVQVNPHMPRILGDCNKLHISKASCIYEDAVSMGGAPIISYTERDVAAAKIIAGRIPDGATIQIGVGRLPDALAPFLKDHRHLGVHTEVFTNSLMEMMKAGIVDNSRKSLLPGKAAFGFLDFAFAARELYDFADNNEQMEMCSISWVNNPYIIGQNKNLVSVNSCLSVDLTGQVCSEALGFKQYAGSGGQLDFVRGAKLSEGGRSYIVCNSVVEKKDGSLISKIDLTLPYGSPVTTPRNDVDAIVTEYGVAELRYRSISERARALIAIAHPSFRDELTFKAREQGYFI